MPSAGREKIDFQVAGAGVAVYGVCNFSALPLHTIAPSTPRSLCGCATQLFG